MNAGPKPSPAIAVPTNRRAAVPVLIEANVTKAPTMRIRQPPSITSDGFFLASKVEAAAARPLSRNIKMPPQTKFIEGSSCAASVGPRDKQKPASAQVPTRAGTAVAKAPLAAGGTLTCGRSELTTPGRTVPGSGIASTATTPAMKVPRNSHQTRGVGAGAYWTSTLAPIAPRAWPPEGAALERTGAAPPLGCKSNSAALAAPEMRPTATPCSAGEERGSPARPAIRDEPPRA